MIRRVVGKSMEPTLLEGDVVVTKKAKPKKNDIVVVAVNGREVIKRVTSVHKSSVEVIGDNADASKDSREYGPLPMSAVGGVVSRIVPKRTLRRLSGLGFGFFLMACVLLAAFSVFSALPAKQPVVIAAAARDTTTMALFQPGTVKKDITYCHGQTLDIYYPRTDAHKAAPTILFIHGGGWFRDEKDNEPMQLVLLDQLRDKGFAVIAIDYRMAPEDLFPKAVDDARCAVRFIRSDATKYGFDGKHVLAFGFSAGGHIAAMLGTVDDADGFVNQPYEKQSSKADAVISLAGLFDFTRGLRTNNRINIDRFLGDQPLDKAQPMTYVDATDAPFLLIHGTKDALVLPDQNALFAERLRQSNVPVTTLDVTNAVHGLESSNDQPTEPTRSEVATIICNFALQSIE